MLRNWVRRFSNSTPPFAALAPDAPFVAIGDIHGRADLLQKALDRFAETQIICVGDYIDRGEQSAQVLALLHAHPHVICLSGNHEEMLLNFLGHPEKYGPQWLRNGGLQTLASFGISGAGKAHAPLRDALKTALGPDLIQWLTSLRLYWQSGNVAVTHAGADPAMPLPDQSASTLHWGHPAFEKQRRRDGVWVVHGHTIVPAPLAANGRIAIDTGAYATGRLTAARITAAGVTFSCV
ncbi:MAG: metallophosphoesterase [Sulfitobacter sp.]